MHHSTSSMHARNMEVDIISYATCFYFKRIITVEKVERKLEFILHLKLSRL